MFPIPEVTGCFYLKDDQFSSYNEMVYCILFLFTLYYSCECLMKMSECMILKQSIFHRLSQDNSLWAAFEKRDKTND